jgi:hypothetical protein
LTQSGWSFIWHKNIIGPSTVPWGTDVSFELSPSTIVLIVLVDRKLVSHEWMFPLMPYCSSLCRSLSCGTVSNALEKSRMAMSTCCPLSCSCKKSLIVVISWVSQEYPDLKPWFIFDRILFFSRCFRRCLQMMCSVFCRWLMLVILACSFLVGVFLLFSSPDPKGHVRYCHQLASVVRPLTFHILIYSSETTGPNGTNGAWDSTLRNVMSCQ